MFGLKKKNRDKPTRNISLGGSLSLNSYYRPGNKASTDTSLYKKPIEDEDSGSRKYSFLILGIFLLILVFASTLSSSVDLSVADDNSVYHEVSEYTETANEILNQSLLNRSKITFNRNDFEAQMRQEYPEIRNISAVIPLGGRDLSVILTVSEPFLRVSSGGETGVVNSAGVLVLESDLIEGGSRLIDLRFATPQDNFVKGSRIITSTEIGMIKLLQKELSKLFYNEGFVIIDEILFNVRDGQMVISLESLDFDLKVSTYTDAEQQVGAIIATMRQFDSEGVNPEQYIDARVPGRIFVK